MQIDKIVLRVSAAFLLNEKKLLVLQRNGEGREPFKWELPGTRLIDEEKYDEALIRDCQKELQLDIKILKEVGSIEVDTDTEVLMVMYILIEGNTEFIKLTEKHVNLKFADYQELYTLDLCRADKEFIKVYQEEIQVLMN
ncbi:MAG: NUDIX domain-containing protein [Spirochaetes bacterium]|nr:NUDIX domain-containing protein [Spirochaetota bacterium]